MKPNTAYTEGNLVHLMHEAQGPKPAWLMSHSTIETHLTRNLAPAGLVETTSSRPKQYSKTDPNSPQHIIATALGGTLLGLSMEYDPSLRDVWGANASPGKIESVSIRCAIYKALSRLSGFPPIITLGQLAEMIEYSDSPAELAIAHIISMGQADVVSYQISPMTNERTVYQGNTGRKPKKDTRSRLIHDILLSNEPMTAGEIAQVTGLSPQDIEKAMLVLVRGGYVIPVDLSGTQNFIVLNGKQRRFIRTLAGNYNQI